MHHKENIIASSADLLFFDRDLSWLSFNERVLMEAENEDVPLMERLNFLSIYSSNLDEFYRVRMPALAGLHKLYKKRKLPVEAVNKHADMADRAKKIIWHQQERFGKVLQRLIPELEANKICLVYGRSLPEEIMPQLTHYFFSQVLAFLQPVFISEDRSNFFPMNNQLYLAVTGTGTEGAELLVVNIPAQELSRFFKVELEGKEYIVFLDDIIKAHLSVITAISVEACYSFKVTRDAEIDLEDVYEEDLVEKLEKQIAKRDFGLATRFLYEPGISGKALKQLVGRLGLQKATLMEGGRYHNLKDLGSISVPRPQLSYSKWSPLQLIFPGKNLLSEKVEKQDFLLHTPYHSYDTVLRFFNEAAIGSDVEKIYLTMYRVASDSRIVNALISAAGNGKQVTVLIELKARFDEANNIKWAKKLEKAGVRVLFTPNDLKVHAKIALVKRKTASGPAYLGLLSTGNMNEKTARLYTDHILLTGHQEMLKEVEQLFTLFDEKGEKLADHTFEHLLVARYNLLDKLLFLIDREISNAKQGHPAKITLKLNNLEERVLIGKLYEASQAGVQVLLIVRGICCLVPGIAGMSENITIRRIVDRYLEHGRIYLFHNRGKEEIFLGSADWMNRNIYNRIEVCFPVYEERLRKELMEIMAIQLKDNVQAVMLDDGLRNERVPLESPAVQSQLAIYNKLADK